MIQKKKTEDLYFVFGGYLKNLDENVLSSSDTIDMVGLFFDYQLAWDAWKEKAQSSIDNAHIRYFLVNLKDLY